MNANAINYAETPTRHSALFKRDESAFNKSSFNYNSLLQFNIAAETGSFSPVQPALSNNAGNSSTFADSVRHNYSNMT